MSVKQLFFLLLFSPLIAVAQSPGSENNVNSTGDTAMEYVDNYENITSFEDVLKQFAGRTVYIDLWATWCGPCIAEFAHKDNLHDFAQKNDIDVLYLSMDQDKDDTKWKKFIQKRELSGFHMRASKRLYKDIQARFSQMYQGRKAFGIPYYIIASDGKVVLKQAPRPSSGELLFTELLNYKN